MSSAATTQAKELTARTSRTGAPTVTRTAGGAPIVTRPTRTGAPVVARPSNSSSSTLLAQTQRVSQKPVNVVGKKEQILAIPAPNPIDINDRRRGVTGGCSSDQIAAMVLEGERLKQIKMASLALDAKVEEAKVEEAKKETIQEQVVALKEETEFTSATIEVEYEEDLELVLKSTLALRCKAYLLTYKSHIDKAELKAHLATVTKCRGGRTEMDFCFIAHESGEREDEQHKYHHTHALVGYKLALSYQDKEAGHAFCFMTDDESLLMTKDGDEMVCGKIHCNILFITHKGGTGIQGALRYVAKEDLECRKEVMASRLLVGTVDNKKKTKGRGFNEMTVKERVEASKDTKDMIGNLTNPCHIGGMMVAEAILRPNPIRKWRINRAWQSEVKAKLLSDIAKNLVWIDSEQEKAIRQEEWVKENPGVSEHLFPGNLEKEAPTGNQCSARKFWWIYGLKGAEGKSKFVDHLKGNMGPEHVANVSCTGNIREFATLIESHCAAGWTGRVLFIDLPRAAVFKGIWEPLESILNGVLTTQKYRNTTVTLKELCHVIVFANFPPVVKNGGGSDTMSKDRFVISQIVEDGTMYGGYPNVILKHIPYHLVPEAWEEADPNGEERARHFITKGDLEDQAPFATILSEQVNVADSAGKAGEDPFKSMKRPIQQGRDAKGRWLPK